jgi:putative transcriptional regulator
MEIVMEMRREMRDATEMQYNLQGKILLATPIMDDDNFIKSVALICVHEDEGTVGVVINKPLAVVTHEDICKQLNIAQKTKASKQKQKYTILRGGPVDSDRLFVLSFEVDDPAYDSSGVEESGGIANNAHITLYTNAPAFLADVAKGVRKERFLLCMGFCAWAAGQLEDEIEENSWLVVEATHKDVFDGDPQKKWKSMINKIGLDDPSKMVPYSGHA